MRICAIQPPYAASPGQAGDTVDFIVRELDSLDGRFDLVLTPEYSNAPSTFTAAELLPFVREHTGRLLEAAEAAARRCQAAVAVCFAGEATCGVLRNMIRVFGPDGIVAGEFLKRHLTAAEREGMGIDSSYTMGFSPIGLVECNGLRLGAMICYDTYFNEYAARLAAMRPDVVLVSSFQRGERQDILRMQGQMLAFGCNSFVLRSSYSMGDAALTGGMSLVASPDGRIVGEFGGKVGTLVCDVPDLHWKYMRSNTFGGELIANDRFVEQGRRPWSYRPAGSMVIPGEGELPYPRICAHRGCGALAPENSLPAFGAAIAMGASEIELDVRFSSDGVPVSIHDGRLERVSNGSGLVQEHTLEELEKMDFSCGYGQALGGMPVLTLEEVLARFARHAIINMHIKGEIEDKGCSNGDEVYPEEKFRCIVELLDRYDCRGHVYLMGSEDVMKRALLDAPDIPRCMGASPDPWRIVDRAVEFKCGKVQLFKPHFNQDMMRHAHDNGIKVNVFWSDEPAEARQFLEMGADCILTNEYWKIRRALSDLHPV